MNWRKGLFRLWAVASLSWVVFVAVIAEPQNLWSHRAQLIADITDLAEQEPDDLQSRKVARLQSLQNAARIERADRQLWDWAQFSIIPPVLLLLMGLLLTWVAAGFRRKSQPD